MKKRIGILKLVVLCSVIIACNNNNTNADPEVLIQNQETPEVLEYLEAKPTFYSLSENFEFTLSSEDERLNITHVTLSADMNCGVDPKMCQEISDFIGNNKLIFSSSEEYSILENMPEQYQMLQKGSLIIGEDSHEASMYYNGINTNDGVSFKGRLIFQLNMLASVKGRYLSVEIKGKNKGK